MITRSPINILYVDDEINNLFSFKAMFRLKYNIQLAQNFKDAIKMLEKDTIHILLTDHRMQDITGLKFVEMIRGKYSRPVPVLVTGYAPEKEANEAIGKGEIYACLSKPWDERKLEQVLNEAYAHYKLENEGRDQAAFPNLLLANQYRMKSQTSFQAL